jgi:hypothetical protein
MIMGEYTKGAWDSSDLLGHTHRYLNTECWSPEVLVKNEEAVRHSHRPGEKGHGR